MFIIARLNRARVESETKYKGTSLSGLRYESHELNSHHVWLRAAGTSSAADCHSATQLVRRVQPSKGHKHIDDRFEAGDS